MSWCRPTPTLRRRLAQSDVRHLPGHHVWTRAKDDEAADGLRARRHRGRRRAASAPVRVRAARCSWRPARTNANCPSPAGPLPGVVGAGGAQAMLKSGLVLPGRRVVVAGSGPLLLAVAASLAAAGATVAGRRRGVRLSALRPAPPGARRQSAQGGEAPVHGAALLRHRVRVRTRSAVTEVHGTDRVDGGDRHAARPRLADRVPGTGRRIDCDALAVGHGLVPQTNWPLRSAAPAARRRRHQRPGAGRRAAKPRARRCGRRARPAGVGGAQLARVGRGVGRARRVRRHGSSGAPPTPAGSGNCSGGGTACVPSPTAMAAAHRRRARLGGLAH